MKIRIGTFNLFQFCSPPYSWYTRKEKFDEESWTKKIAWIKNQILEMNCDIIGFQEVFSQKELQDLCKNCGYEYFICVDKPKIKKDSTIYTSTTVALASKYPITNIKSIKTHIPSIKKHNFDGHFKFSRSPIKADIKLPNNFVFTMYVCHLKSNRENEFEYVFTKNDTLENKLLQVNKALKENYSKSLKQRLVEASSLFYDIKKEKKAKILLCDLNDKEFSITIDALTNNKYHDKNKKQSFILSDAYYQHKIKIKNPHPEKNEIKRKATSFFAGKGNVLDYIFISNEFNNKNPNAKAKVTNYTLFDNHLEKNPHGNILESDHAQVVCELMFS